MKNSRIVIILLMVFVALAAFLAAQNAQQSSAPPTSQAQQVLSQRIFPDLQINDIQAIRLRSPETGDSFVISRGGDGAWTAPDSSGTLNTTEADNIARTMVLLPYSRTLTVSPGDDLAPYGFTPEGILSVEIIQTDGASHAVAVGYRNPTATGYYGLIDDRPDLYLLDRGAVDFLISRLKSPPVA